MANDDTVSKNGMNDQSGKLFAKGLLHFVETILKVDFCKNGENCEFLKAGIEDGRRCEKARYALTFVGENVENLVSTMNLIYYKIRFFKHELDTVLGDKRQFTAEDIINLKKLEHLLTVSRAFDYYLQVFEDVNLVVGEHQSGELYKEKLKVIPGIRCTLNVYEQCIGMITHYDTLRILVFECIDASGKIYYQEVELPLHKHSDDITVELAHFIDFMYKVVGIVVDYGQRMLEQKKYILDRKEKFDTYTPQEGESAYLPKPVAVTRSSWEFAFAQVHFDQWDGFYSPVYKKMYPKFAKDFENRVNDKTGIQMTREGIFIKLKGEYIREFGLLK